jgi:hypothetical protein
MQSISIGFSLIESVGLRDFVQNLAVERFVMSCGAVIGDRFSAFAKIMSYHNLVKDSLRNAYDGITCNKTIYRFTSGG